jgi:hypothetical protein
VLKNIKLMPNETLVNCPYIIILHTMEEYHNLNYGQDWNLIRLLVEFIIVQHENATNYIIYLIKRCVSDDVSIRYPEIRKYRKKLCMLIEEYNDKHKSEKCHSETFGVFLG